MKFQAYAAGCNIIILANTFERVQVIPGVCHDNIQISCVDCSTDTGKIAAAYGKLVCVFEPTPLLSQNNTHVSCRFYFYLNFFNSIILVFLNLVYKNFWFFIFIKFLNHSA